MLFPVADPGLHGLQDRIWPVGSIYVSADDVSPAVKFGFGTWVAFGAGRVLVGLDAGQAEFDTLGETGGAKDVTLTVAHLPAHTHTLATGTGTTGNFAQVVGTVDASSGGTGGTPTQTALGTISGSTGGGQAHPNLPPYVVVRFWHRTG